VFATECDPLPGQTSRGVVIVDQRIEQMRISDGKAMHYFFFPVNWGTKDTIDWFALLKLLGIKMQESDPETYELMDLEDADNCGG